MASFHHYDCPALVDGQERLPELCECGCAPSRSSAIIMPVVVIYPNTTASPVRSPNGPTWDLRP